MIATRLIGLIGLGVLMTLGGCARTDSVILKYYPPRADNHVIEILSSAPTDKKYEEIALLNAKGGQTIVHDRGTSGVIEQMKVEARKVGADAIIIGRTQRGNYNWGQGGFDRSNADSVAIRYLP